MMARRGKRLLPWLFLCLLAPLPVLLALWAGAGAGQIALLAAVQCCLMALFPALVSARLRQDGPLGPPNVMPRSRAAIEAMIDAAQGPMPDTAAPPPEGAAIVLRLDDAPKLRRLYGAWHTDALMTELSRRLGKTLRAQDGYCLLPPDGFGVALRAQGDLDLASATTIARRLQEQLGAVFRRQGLSSWHSLSVGLCLSPQAARRQGISMIEAASRAAEIARRRGPGGLHSFHALDSAAPITRQRQHSVLEALENGQIRAHFQPQIAADSGRVTGLEALARWERPGQQIVGPGEFLPLIETASMTPRLTERMLADALDLLSTLEKAGIHVPSVAINLSAQDLRKASLADEIGWALDSRDLAPERLVVEILEDVVTDSDEDMAVRSIARLAGMGCGIDLDDFGTGHASIANIRRFAIGRLKIDRSFVRNLHQDANQRKLVSAVLSMAAELDLDTLAEGVECPEEMALLARMGCGHLQGFAIARPMPADAVAGWLGTHAQSLAAADAAGRAGTPAGQTTAPGAIGPGVISAPAGQS